MVLSFRLRMFLASSANAGVQFMQSIMFALSAPLFQSLFRIPASSVTIIFAVVGPVSGIIFQPLVGAWSDRYQSKFGKRRPFILLGSIFSSIGMLILAFSALIGQAFGDSASGTTMSDHKWGISFALIGFIWMNICANIVQGPARSLIGDLAPPSKQQLAQSLVQTSVMIAAVIAPLIGVALFYGNAP